jgi:hypothetical protein
VYAFEYELEMKILRNKYIRPDMSSVYILLQKKKTRGRYSDGTVTITRLEIAGKICTVLPGGRTPFHATATFPIQINLRSSKNFER